MSLPPLRIKLDNPECMPKRAYRTDAGLDLKAVDEYLLEPDKPVLIDTGVAVQIAPGFVGLVFSRSGHGIRGISLANSVGVIDSDYRGNIKVALVYRPPSMSEFKWITINKGEKIAQLVVAPIILPKVEVVNMSEEEWFDTARGAGGFGSTGN